MTEFTTWRSLVDGTEISAIPDGLISQFKISEDEDETLVNEFDEQPNATVGNQNLISVGDFVNGHGLDFDGSDVVTINDLYDFVGPGKQFAFAATVDISDLSDNQVVWKHDKDDGDSLVSFGAAGDGSTIGARFASDNGTVEIGNANATTERMRVGGNFDGDNGLADIAINGVISNDNSERPVFRNEGSNLLGGNEGGEKADMILDNPCWFPRLLSDDEFTQDFEAQPWS